MNDSEQPATLYTWRVNVQGVVQGVFYRANTRDEALKLDVTGWVRNEPDGGVSAVLQHVDDTVLSRLVAWMRHGPPGARVTELALDKLESAPRYDRFEIRRW